MKRTKLKLWRVANNLTQDELAKSLNTDGPRMNQIELGKRDPDYKLLVTFERVYNEPNVWELFKKDGE